MSVNAQQLSDTLVSVVENTGKSIVRVDGQRRRSASGIVYAPNLVVTANHILERDEGVLVGIEGAELKAKVRGRDASTDLALLEVEGTLPPASWDDGGGLKVGQLALLLARPGETVRATSGILSAVGKKPWRTMRGGEIDRFLESDAPHQPGFSGGALVSLEGKVLGLTSTGLRRQTSLTIPTLTVKRVVEQLSTHGKLRRSYLGLSLQPLRLPEEVRTATGEEVGLLVMGVDKGGPADLTGLKYGDTVLHLGDDSVKTLQDFYGWLKADHVGQQVPVKFFRDGKVETRELTLGERP
jgi:S1-C subfamily serine protease